MSTATVTRRLHAEGHPVELVRGNGYHYFVWDDGSHFDSLSIMECRFRCQSVDAWVRDGREFADEVRAKLAEQAAFEAAVAAERAAKTTNPDRVTYTVDKIGRKLLVTVFDRKLNAIAAATFTNRDRVAAWLHIVAPTAEARIPEAR